jgi:hypothetical protein
MPGPLALLSTPAAGTILGGLGILSSVPFYFGAGQPSEEEQERSLRRQLEIQDEFEQQRAARAGGANVGMDELGGLVGGGVPRNLEALALERDMTRSLSGIGRNVERARQSLGRRNSELDALLLGSEIRLANLQNERKLTPMEIIRMSEAMGF